MKIKCPKCGSFISSKVATYQYKESGIDNIFLENIPVYDCSCGISFASIFRVPRLNELISKTLLKKPSLLKGNEIRFLRKSLYMSSKSFAEKLSIGKTTLSKWENDIQPHRVTYDKLIRLLYTVYKGIDGNEIKDILSIFDTIQIEDQDFEYIITAEKEEDDYIVNYRPVFEGQGQEIQIVWLSPEGLMRPTSSLQKFTFELSSTESDQMFSSNETLSTETVSIYS